jgi:hypothetical protein
MFRPYLVIPIQVRRKKKVAQEKIKSEVPKANVF